MLYDFFKGISDIKSGLSYLVRNRFLFKYLIPPFLTNLGLFILMLFVLSHYYSPLYSFLIEALGGMMFEGVGWWVPVVAGLLWVVKTFLHVLLITVMVIVLMVLMLFIAQMINGPFYEMLSEAVMKKETGIKDTFDVSFGHFFGNLLRSIGIELKKLLFFIVIPVLLFILYFVPFVGYLAYAVIAHLFAAWDLGFNYLSYPMTIKLIPFRKQVALALRHKARLTGFGVPLMIPFLNIIAAPVFVIGGTLLYLDLNRADHRD